MKKRIISLLLCMLTVLPLLLTGCSNDEDVITKVNEEASRNTKTLAMYLMTGDETTPEAAAAVEEAVNKITKAKFKAQVKIYYLTEAEYYEKLEAVFVAKDAELVAAEEAELAKKRAEAEMIARGETVAITTAGETEETKEETMLDENGMIQLVYPELEPNQVDIFFLNDYNRYLKYIENEWVSGLNEELSGASKKLKTYVSSVFLDAAKIEGTTYAIPNNTVIGEYTYLLLDKKLLAKYCYDAKTMTSYAKCKEFLSDIKTYEPDYVPIVGDLDMTGVHYWSVEETETTLADGTTQKTYELDRNKFNVLGNIVSNNATLGALVPVKNIFAIASYKEQLLALQYFKDNGFIGQDGDTRPFAAKVVKGGAELAKTYAEDYEMVVIDTPRAYREDLYNGMFAVGGESYTKDVARSMEIITYINTNPEFRNLIQYGIEGKNYEIDPVTGALTRLNHTYMMDIKKTGNVFLAYPEEGQPLDVWTYGKTQNLAAKLDPMLGFTIEAEDNPYMEQINHFNELSVSYEERLKACTNYAELEAFLTAAEAEIAKDTYLASAQKMTDENGALVEVEKIVDGKTQTEEVQQYGIYYLYFTWYDESGFNKE